MHDVVGSQHEEEVPLADEESEDDIVALNDDSADQLTFNVTLSPPHGTSSLPETRSTSSTTPAIVPFEDDHNDEGPFVLLPSPRRCPTRANR
ncbi:unnamed protein product [Linum trigynum]|uniref:Uncharacterized protein n=1 Tax=Linum trigynum TaxID=586398 RepID=A0AAV2DY41_9ROSI